jgi:FkbM family methyltransferase
MRAYLLANKKPKINNLGFYINGNKDQANGKYEIQIASYLEANLFKYDRIINIGANIGYWPLFMRNLKFTGQIDAIEPDYFNFLQLKKNIARNGFTVNLLNVAVSNTNTSITLYGFGTGISSLKGWAGGYSRRKQDVSCIKLDDLFDNQFKNTLLIVDVEGAELDVLASGEKFLQSNSEILVEISLSEHVPSGSKLNPTFLDTFKLIHKYGYSSFTWCNDFTLLDNNMISKIMDAEIIPTIQMYCFKK